MYCTAYRTRTGHLLLVPDCMVATREAEHRFGPLDNCGTIDTDRLPGSLQDVVERDFNARSYHRLADGFARNIGLATPSEQAPMNPMLPASLPSPGQ